MGAITTRTRRHHDRFHAYHDSITTCITTISRSASGAHHDTHHDKSSDEVLDMSDAPKTLQRAGFFPSDENSVARPRA